MIKSKRISNKLAGYAVVFAMAFVMLFMLTAVHVNAEDSDKVDSLVIAWTDSSGEILARYNYDTDTFTSEDAAVQLPNGVSYDKASGILTLENVSIDRIFYRGTKDLNIYVKGTTSLDKIQIDDGREGILNPETGWLEYECYHGGDITIYGDGRSQSTLNADWIWQETTVGSLERLEPNADDGDVIIKDLTLNGNLLESAISNLSVESCDVVLTKTEEDGEAAINAGGSPDEYENPEGLFTVKDSTIEVIDGQISVLDFALNGEYFYGGNAVGQADFEADLENNYYKKAYGYYAFFGAKYYLITPDKHEILTNISNAEITLNKSAYTYNGNAQTPVPTVAYGGKALQEGTDYTVAYENNVNAGTAAVVLTGTGAFKGTARKTFTIGKAANSITAVGKTVKLKAKKLKKKAQSVTAAKAVTVAKAQGAVSYRLAGVTKAKFKKYFKVNTATGKITVKKGLKKGTYKVKVDVTAAGNSNYSPATRQVIVVVKVK